MASFDIAIQKLLKHEGGYTAGLVGDPGGETNYGIARASHPDLDIKNLTKDQAIDIYKSDYWTGRIRLPARTNALRTRFSISRSMRDSTRP